mmetsp:Transcript_24170/g.75595  ORF Transcript_24170/g.75595 Transcript_24170/m.75595 type:complete len:152 (+) Transcript_24170:51-506(+)
MAPATPAKRTAPSDDAVGRRKQARSRVEEDVSGKGREPAKSATSRKLNFEPSALNKLIFYTREGESDSLPPEKRTIYDFIVSSCEVPADFERNHKYGPKSGISYEERLINAFCFELFPIPPHAETFRPELRRLVANRRWREAADAVTAKAC